MNMIESTSAPNAAYQVLATAVALQVERMSQEELQALVEKAGADLRAENKSLRDRIAQLEKENTRLLHTIGRLEFGEEGTGKVLIRKSRRFLSHKRWPRPGSFLKDTPGTPYEPLPYRQFAAHIRAVF